jgi:hypothetical protein
MLKFLGKLFGAADRVEVASDRLAAAVEGIAADLESVRAALRDRFGMEALPAPAAALPSPATTALPAPEESAEPTATGRKRGKAAPAA